MEQIAAIKKRETECDASRCERECLYLHNNLLCEIVSHSGFTSACEYCISSSSNVSNL